MSVGLEDAPDDQTGGKAGSQFVAASLPHLSRLLQVGPSGLFWGGSSFNDGTTQTGRDPLEGGPARTNHNCHLARLGVTVVFVKPPQAAYSVHASSSL